MTMLPALPILVPLSTAIACLAAYRAPTVQRVMSIAGAAALVAATLALFVEVLDKGVVTLQSSGWPAPWGITLAADVFGAGLALCGAVVFFACVIASLAGIDRRREAYGYHVLLHTLMMGVGGAFVTGDLFNLYVWFEVMLMSSFVLVALGGDRGQFEGALKYVTLNLVSSGLFLAGAGITYGLAGSLNMADLSQRLAGAREADLAAPAAALFFVAFGLKAGVFPLYFWLPASYHRPPAVVSALFGGLMTKVGVFALARVFFIVFPEGVSVGRELLGAIAGLTMIVGLLGAIAQTNLRRMLSFALIGHIGYMVMGLAIGSPMAVSGMALYAAQHMLVMTGLFLCTGLIVLDRSTEDIRSLGGLWAERPFFAGVFLVLAAALAGVPPSPGFFGKLALVRAAVEAQSWWMLASLLTASVLTLYLVARLWLEVFARPRAHVDGGTETLARPLPWSMLWSAVAITVAIVGLAAASGPAFVASERAASTLVDPSVYVDAVLERKP